MTFSHPTIRLKREKGIGIPAFCALRRCAAAHSQRGVQGGGQPEPFGRGLPPQNTAVIKKLVEIMPESSTRGF